MTFCQVMLSRYATNWPPSEDKLAEEFVSFFQVGLFPSLDGWVQLFGSLDIQVDICALPRELRGYHCCYENTRSIWLNEEELFVGSKEHTLLHELREILEHIFEELGQPMVGKEFLETLAEQFASYVRLVAMGNTWKILFESLDLDSIQSRWAQLGCLLLIGVGSFFYFFYLVGCGLLPYLEDQAARQMGQPLPYERNVRLCSGTAAPHPPYQKGLGRVSHKLRS